MSGTNRAYYVGKHERAIVQVKSGKVKPADVRDLIGAVTAGDYALGVFVTLEAPTQEMKVAALSAGYYEPKLWGSDIPRLQIVTIQELLSGAQIKVPLQTRMGKRSLRVKDPLDQPLRLFDDSDLDA